jgi:DNA mismatch repair protein MutL
VQAPKPERRPIRLLDPGCVERIAAGEVIERPASVVKELIENSLDAGASQLRIVLRGGGLEFLQVEDDGHGIAARELPLAVERHATSKIAGSGDLSAIVSFGFRGEALASIAAVSRFSIRSRVAEESVGARLDLVGGRLERREPVARLPGTTIEVADLFFNVPARRAFARGEQQERRAITQTVQTLALAHPAVAFRLMADEQNVLDLPAVKDLETRAHALFGASVAEQLRRFEGEWNGIRVEGLCSRPTYTRGNRTGQYFYVNRRAIFDKSIAHAVSMAYRDVIAPGRFPLCLVFLEIHPARVDVNVHPTKQELRFRDEGGVHTLLRHALQEALQLRHEEPEAMTPRLSTPEARALARLEATAHQSLLEGPTEGYASGPLWSRSKASPTLFEEPAGEGFRPSGAPVDPGLFAQRQRAEPTTLFWQLHDTFILTQIRGALVIVDQHNSHERILYNEARRALDGQPIAQQQLLFPVTLELSPDELAVYEVHRGDLERVGFVTEPFGGSTVLVRAIPGDLRNWNEGALLRDILVDLAEAGQSARDPREAILASYACHGAIRAGERLSLPEMQSLMDRLFATDLPYSCPHGRPTLVRLGLPELERRFGRR